MCFSLPGGRPTFVLPALAKQLPHVIRQAGLLQAGGMLLLCSAVWLQPSHAVQPRIEDVPAGPAFVQLPGASEVNARAGQALTNNTLLRTNQPGRMQVLLGNGRQFRMGGDAQLRLGSSGVELLKGSIIGWIQPGASPLNPFRITTRLATASIQGTTVFIEYTDEHFKVFSWEGTVTVETRSGQRFTLTSGQQLLLALQGQMARLSDRLDGLQDGLSALDTASSRLLIWDPPQSIPVDDAERRLETSPLINGFSRPLETLPVIERELGLTAPNP